LTVTLLSVSKSAAFHFPSSFPSNNAYQTVPVCFACTIPAIVKITNNKTFMPGSLPRHAFVDNRN
jgi:hypothetical protein